jgi:hypothetical protein
MVVRRRLPLMTFLQDGDAFPLEAAQARVRRELDRHLAAVNPLGSFFFWNRVRRGIGVSSFGINGAFDVYTPYLDYDVFDHLTSLTVDNFTDRKFHTEAIHRAFPQYAHIPFESKKKEPASNPRGYLLRNWLNLLGHLLWRGGGVINMRYVVPRLVAYSLLGKAKPVWYDSASIYAIQLKEMVERYQLSTRDGTRASAGCSSL